MAKKREDMIAELEGRHIGYGEDMSNNELAELLREAKKAEKEQADLEKNIDYTGIKCGLVTMQDIHRRLTIVERKLDNAG